MTTTNDRERSCDARIDAHLESRAEDFATLFAISYGEKTECPTCAGTGVVYEAGENDADCAACDGTGEITPTYDGVALTDEEAIERLDEYPLGASIRRSIRIELSTGGPGDWLDADIDEDGSVIAVEYHFNDWFDHAQRTVADGSPLWRAAEYYAEYIVESS